MTSCILRGVLDVPFASCTQWTDLVRAAARTDVIFAARTVTRDGLTLPLHTLPRPMAGISPPHVPIDVGRAALHSRSLWQHARARRAHPPPLS